MRAWLERVAPPGERIELPDGSGAILFGRSSRATLVIDDPLVAARHCEVYFEKGFWRVKDLGTPRGTRVNGVALLYPRALSNGDLIELGLSRLRFGCEEAPENRGLIDAVLRSPDDQAPYLVWADFLQEHGDPLGERISRTCRGEPSDHHPWLGPLWELFLSGELHVDWHLGFIRGAAVRTAAGKLPPEPASTISQLLGLRAACLLRALVVDVPRLAVELERPVLELSAEVQAAVAAAPVLPPLLSTLSFGARLDASGPELPWLPALASRLPALTRTPLCPRATATRLILIEAGAHQVVTGLSQGSRALDDVTRLRRAHDHALHLEASPATARTAAQNPCFFTREGPSWVLYAGQLKGTLRVNGRADGSWALMDGDVIELPGALRLRFELAT